MLFAKTRQLQEQLKAGETAMLKLGRVIEGMNANEKQLKRWLDEETRLTSKLRAQGAEDAEQWQVERAMLRSAAEKALERAELAETQYAELAGLKFEDEVARVQDTGSFGRVDILTPSREELQEALRLEQESRQFTLGQEEIARQELAQLSDEYRALAEREKALAERNEHQATVILRQSMKLRKWKRRARRAEAVIDEIREVV